jgi:polyhydroxybutyrate depolymerase
MKKTLLLITFLILSNHLIISQTNLYDSINVGGKWRTFLTHLPSGYNPGKKYPLVLAFHGGSPLGYQPIQYQSQLSQKADSSEFIVVYPEGVKIAGNRTWNAGGCCAPASSLNIDDIGFVNSLLNNLFSKHSIETTRVYATGFSNGALLCYRLANQLANRFAAIAVVAGDLMYYPWNPSKAIPIISFHSYADQNVKYFGGVTIGATGTYFPPQDSMFKVISAQYNCANSKDTLYHNTSKYDHFKYSNCACNTIIEQYVSYDGEHSWPGGLSSGTPVSKQFSATYLMWQFFQNYTSACSTAGIYAMKEDENLIIYPNPFTNKINLKNNNPIENYSLLNAMGEIVYSGHDMDQKEFYFLPNGLYFLRAGNKIFKLLKQ